MAKVAVTKTKKKVRRKKRSLSEKLWIGIAILLSISMVLTTVAALFGNPGHSGFLAPFGLA